MLIILQTSKNCEFNLERKEKRISALQSKIVSGKQAFDALRAEVQKL